MIEVGNGGKHTEQIKAAKEARDASIEKMGGTKFRKFTKTHGAYCSCEEITWDIN